MNGVTDAVPNQIQLSKALNLKRVGKYVKDSPPLVNPRPSNAAIFYREV